MNWRARVGLKCKAGRTFVRNVYMYSLDLITTYLSAGLTGIFLSTNWPPLAKTKWLRLVLPPSAAPKVVVKDPLGSEMGDYESSFCTNGETTTKVGEDEQEAKRRHAP